MVRVGLADGYKLGHWTPVWITLPAKDQALVGDLEITVPDGDDVPVTFTGGALSGIEVPAGDARMILGYVRIGRRQASLKYRFISRAKDGPSFTRTLRASELPPAALASQQRVIVLGGKIDLEQAVRFLPRSSGEEIVAGTIDSADALPDRWFGYDGVDALVLTGSQPEFYEALSDAQRTAIVEWVRHGGRAIVTVGSQGERALGSDKFLAQFAPGRFQRTASLNETAVLESLIDAQTKLAAPVDGEIPPPLVATQLFDPHGEIILAAGVGRPIIVRSPLGFGEVLFVAFDLDQDPIARWPDRGRLISHLLEALWRNAPAVEETHRSGEAAHLGYHDLTGQLTAALDQFQGVRLIPFSWVAGLIVIYILLIGPVDYFLLRRIGRMELTWLTFGLVAVALGATAWWLADWARGTSLRLNQVDIVDIDSTTAQVRGTTWLRIYSPRNERFALQLEPTTAALAHDDHGMLFAWQGLPGRSLSGMDAGSTANLEAQRYFIRDTRPASGPPVLAVSELPLLAVSELPLLAVSELPLSVGATKGFVGRWWGEGHELRPAEPLTSRSEKLLRGRVTNPLPVRLQGCVLYHDRWAYKLGPLEPGQTISLDDTAFPLDVKWLLTERTVVDSRDLTTPWDRAQRDDVPRILQMLMFHETAGGRGYTGLLHRYDNFIDLSGQLTAGRAVLIGRADESATKLIANDKQVDGEQDQHWTYYRIVLPTRPEARQP